MGNQNQIQTAGNNPVAIVRSYLSNIDVKARLEETLGKRAGAFSNSILNVVRNSAALQKCTPDSIMSAAMIAATMNLPIDPALGQAAIVPYKNQAVFQIMYKGITQLCIRSGKYLTIHCSEIYRDELKSHNPITGEVVFNEPETFKLRYEDKGDANIVGHYAHFKLLSGFEKSDFMTTAEALAHAKKYSKAYQYDLRDKKKTSMWSKDPVPMGNKTILIRVLSKYGVMSLDMQEAFIVEQQNFEQEQADAEERIRDETGSEVINIEPEPAPENPQETPQEQEATETEQGKPAFMQGA